MIFRYSQGKDSTVGGSGISGVCEGMCYNFVRHFVLQPYTSYQQTGDLYQDFKAQKAAGEFSGGVFVKDTSKQSQVELTESEKPGERQAASGVRFSQAVRNLDAKFKKPLSEKAKETIVSSVASRIYSDTKPGEYTEFRPIKLVRKHMQARDSSAEIASAKDFLLSHLAPLLTRDGVKETMIGYGDMPISDLAYATKEEQTPETLGKLFGKELRYYINSQPTPQRVLAICDVAKDQSGHAIAIDAENPNGPICVLDPNFGLIKYSTWDNFVSGFGKMWKLYQLSYNKYALRRYTKA